MNRLVTSFVVLSFFAQALAFASEGADIPKKKEKKKVCFNLFCKYKKEVPGSEKGFEKCRAASRFEKLIYEDGTEVQDTSDHPDNPTFQVECDSEVIYNNSAHRYTDHLGTRIQAIGNPYPAVLLPRNSLKSERGYLRSTLELEDQTLHGHCYIYTGLPLVD